MDKQELKPQRQYKNIYMFSSLTSYGETRERRLRTIKFNEDDCIVVFNCPNRYTQKLLKNRKINYLFCRAFGVHLPRTVRVLKSGIFDMKGVEIINEGLDDSDSHFSKFKTFKLRNDIHINNVKVDAIDYFKQLGYRPNKNRNVSPSMGFKSIILLNLLYQDAMFHLIGFENVIKEKECAFHNYKFEYEYLEKSNIKHVYL